MVAALERHRDEDGQTKHMTNLMKRMLLIRNQTRDSLEMALESEAARTRTATAELEQRMTEESTSRLRDGENKAETIKSIEERFKGPGDTGHEERGRQGQRQQGQRQGAVARRGNHDMSSWQAGHRVNAAGNRRERDQGVDVMKPPMEVRNNCLLPHAPKMLGEIAQLRASRGGLGVSRSQGADHHAGELWQMAGGRPPWPAVEI